MSLRTLTMRRIIHRPGALWVMVRPSDRTYLFVQWRKITYGAARLDGNQP